MATDAGLDGSYRRKRRQRFDDEWHFGYPYARALTIGDGTGEVQRSIVSKGSWACPRPRRQPDLGRGPRPNRASKLTCFFDSRLLFQL